MTPGAGEPVPQSKLMAASSRTRAGLPLSVVSLKYSPRQLAIGVWAGDHDTLATAPPAFS